MTFTSTKLTSAITPDLVKVGEFMRAQVEAGQVDFMVDSVLGLLVRMRDTNLELIRRDAARRRAKPPSETSRRLMQEMLFDAAPPANVNGGDTDAPAGEPAVAAADGATEGSTSPETDPKQGAAAGPLANPLGPKKRGPRKRHEHGRSKLPAHLPRQHREHHVPDAQRVCPHCHTEAEHVAFRLSGEVLDIEPARFVVRQELCETVACPGCRGHIVTADLPARAVECGLLGDNLLVEALVEHYGEAVPFERMERRAEEQGVPLRANTLARGVARALDLFDPIVEEIARRVAASDDLGLDATSTRVLDPTHPLGIRFASLWLLTGGHEYALFRYAKSADSEALMAAFKDVVFKNARLTCDASPTMNCLERDGAIRAGCNAHGRRGLATALRGDDLRAAEGIALYGTLFHIEAESKRASEPYLDRHTRRQRESRPAAAALRAWIDERRLDVEPKSTLGKALGYLHRQWDKLMRFLDDPLLEMTNNEVERDLRTHVLNRKSWYFCGDDASATRMANALTLIITCRKLGVPPRAYLSDALARLLRGDKDLAAMMPDAFAERRRQEQQRRDADASESAPDAAAA